MVSHDPHLPTLGFVGVGWGAGWGGERLDHLDRKMELEKTVVRKKEKTNLLQGQVLS